MSKEEREKYDESIRVYRDNMAVANGQRELGFEEGEKKGYDKGKKEGKEEGIKEGIKEKNHEKKVELFFERFPLRDIYLFHSNSMEQFKLTIKKRSLFYKLILSQSSRFVQGNRKSPAFHIEIRIGKLLILLHSPNSWCRIIYTLRGAG